MNKLLDSLIKQGVPSGEVGRVWDTVPYPFVYGGPRHIQHPKFLDIITLKSVHFAGQSSPFISIRQMQYGIIALGWDYLHFSSVLLKSPRVTLKTIGLNTPWLHHCLGVAFLSTRLLKRRIQPVVQPVVSYIRGLTKPLRAIV